MCNVDLAGSPMVVIARLLCDNSHPQCKFFSEGSCIVQLRDYQVRDVARIRAALRTGRKSVIYVAPCGAGKTVMFCDLARRVVEKSKNVLILVHRRELIEQTVKALHEASIEPGIIAAGVPACYSRKTQVASVQSLARRSIPFIPHLIIVDEAHHVAAKNTWARVISNYPNAYRLGVSATPCRLDGRPLADAFDRMVLGPTYEVLRNGGFLTRLKAWAPPTVDVTGVGVRGGEFIASQVLERCNASRVTGDAIEHYKLLGSGRRAVLFDISIDSARRRAIAFREAGFTAEAIDGTLTQQQRAAAVARFRGGDTQVLCTVDLVSEGFDLPAIEVGISLRPTLSLSLWMQQAGRLLRPSPGKRQATLIDHAGNTLRHGFPDDERPWSLDRALSRAKEPGAPGLRLCLKCFAVARPWMKVCPECGEPFPVKPRIIEEEPGLLSEISRIQAHESAQAFKRAQGRARTLEELVRLGRRKGMRNPEGWARHILKARGARHD